MPNLQVAIIGSEAAREQYGAALRYLPQIDIAGLIDADRRAYRAWTDIRTDRISVFPDLHALLEIHSKTQLVLISAVQKYRSFLITSSLNSGCSALAPAPFASSLSSTSDILKLAEKHSAAALPIFLHRHTPYYLAFRDEMRKLISSPTSSARSEFRVSQEYNSHSGETLKEMVIRTAITALDWGRWCFGEALSVSADMDMQMNSNSSAVSIRKPLSPQMATILVQYERASCTHQITLARGQTSYDKVQFINEEGMLELTTRPFDTSLGTSHLQWRSKNGTVAETFQTDVPNNLDLSPLELQTYHLLADLSKNWQEMDKQNASFDARMAQELYVAALISSQTQSKVRLPYKGCDNIDICQITSY